jgi:hypothetical protein
VPNGAGAVGGATLARAHTRSASGAHLDVDAGLRDSVQGELPHIVCVQDEQVGVRPLELVALEALGRGSGKVGGGGGRKGRFARAGALGLKPKNMNPGPVVILRTLPWCASRSTTSTRRTAPSDATLRGGRARGPGGRGKGRACGGQAWVVACAATVGPPMLRHEASRCLRAGETGWRRPALGCPALSSSIQFTPLAALHALHSARGWKHPGDGCYVHPWYIPGAAAKGGLGCAWPSCSSPDAPHCQVNVVVGAPPRAVLAVAVVKAALAPAAAIRGEEGANPRTRRGRGRGPGCISANGAGARQAQQGL